MSEPARLLLSEATYPEQGVRQVLGASLPDREAPASEQNTPCLPDSYAWGGSPCPSVANYPAVSQALCISTCKLHFLWERRGQAEGQGKRWWEFSLRPPKEKGVAEVDEGGPDLNEARAYRNAWKTRKPGSLCMGEALSSLQRGREGVGEAEVRWLPGEDAPHGDMHSFGQLLGREREMQREFPHSVTMTLADTTTCFPPPINNTVDTASCSGKAVWGQSWAVRERC